MACIYITGVTEWVRRWKVNSWRTSTGEGVKNEDLIKRLDQLATTRKHPVKWVHVYGHKGETGNEEADKLANRGSLMAEVKRN